MNNIYLYINNPLDLPDADAHPVDKITEIQDNSVDAFYLLDLLDYCTDNCDWILTTITNKLKDNGKIIIQAPDIKQLIVAISFNTIDFNHGRSILYSNRLRMHTMLEIVKIIQSYKYDCIIKTYINTFEYFLEFKK